ncbi:MAG: CAP domain-containing protein [Bacteroidales bacterium]|nr:CAP domain-containing protein [Bacteroidales bacterium]
MINSNRQLSLFTYTLIVFSIFSTILPAQENQRPHVQNFDGFSHEQYVSYLAADGWPVELLNTAATAIYLSDNEKNVVLAMNLIRHDPAKYAKLYVQPLLDFFDGTLLRLPGKTPLRTREGAEAVRELYRELMETNPVQLLLPSEGMSRAAMDHARFLKRTGNAGHEGRGGMGARLSRHGSWDIGIAENLHWGADNAHDAVLSLMIDDGVKNRGHRINILDPDFKYVGVGIDSHPRLHISYVIKHAVKFTEK